MSFFCAIKGNAENLELGEHLKLYRVAESQAYLRHTVDRFFGCNSDVYILGTPDDDTCQELIEATQNVLANRQSIFATEFGKLVLQSAEQGLELYLWYATDNGAEFEHVCRFSDANAFLECYTHNIQISGIFETLRLV